MKGIFEGRRQNHWLTGDQSGGETRCRNPHTGARIQGVGRGKSVYEGLLAFYEK